jgi:manganese/iron transport system substrate-binding protein
MRRIQFAAVLFVFTFVVGAALPVIPPSARAQEPLHVVASFSILADVVQQVAGDAVTVETLIPLGSNPHAFEPSARDVATLSDADLVFVVGINFEEGLLDVLDEAAGDKVVVVSECVPVRDVNAGFDQQHADENSHGEGGVSEGENGGHQIRYQIGKLEEACPAHHELVALAFDGERTGDSLGLFYEGVCDGTASCDPHVWTDPANAALWAFSIADALSVDSDNAGIYLQNAYAYVQQLAALDADIQALITDIPAEQRVMVTNHLTFNYFAARYGLTTVGVILPGGSTGSEPSARDVIDLIDTINKSGASAIFTETTVSDGLAQQIADESGAQIVQLYTGSLSDADGPAATYIDYMRYNAGQIAAALQ